MPTKKDHLLQNLIEAGYPIISLYGPDDGPSESISYSYQPQMTVEQHTAAQAMINAFDWSDAAHGAWVLSLERALHIDEINNIQNMVLRAIVKLSIDQFNLGRSEVIGVVESVWDPGNIANGAGLTSPNVTVTGAQFNDEVLVTASGTLSGLIAHGYVSASNTVVVRLHNGTGGAVNLPSMTWRVIVRRTVARSQITMSQAKAAIVDDITQGLVDS